MILRSAGSARGTPARARNLHFRFMKKNQLNYAELTKVIMTLQAEKEQVAAGFKAGKVTLTSLSQRFSCGAAAIKTLLDQLEIPTGRDPKEKDPTKVRGIGRACRKTRAGDTEL